MSVFGCSITCHHADICVALVFKSNYIDTVSKSIIFFKLAARTFERNLNDLRKENAYNRQK